MSDTSSTLHMVCGKIASGKSTLASRLASRQETVLIAEDDWLYALFSDQLTSIADYVRCTSKLRTIMGPHISSLLTAGISVVLDFPANTVETRAWMRGILEKTNAAHHLHVLHASDETCLARLKQRNADGDHPFAVTEEHFRQITRHYAAPSPDEGFTVVMHDGTV